MDYLACFAEDYAHARAKFLLSCTEAGARLTRHVHPEQGPDDLELSTDVAYFGPDRPRKLLVVVSGTHGPEGFCGSGCQLHWVRSGAARRLPAGTGVLLVHFINPFGGAWLCRETEGNIDLNRNFVAHAAPLPDNGDYEDIHDALLLDGLEGDAYERSQRRYDDAKRRVGEGAFLNALSNGQYSRSDGFYFGGHAPAWSNRTLHAILAPYVATVRQVAVIDYHTGYGPFGYGTPICLDAGGTAALQRAFAWYGESVMAPFAGEAQIFSVSGSLLGACRAIFAAAAVTAVVLEYGTYAPERDVALHRRMNWLWRTGHLRSPDYESVRREYVTQFYPQGADWKEMIVMRSEQLIRQSIDGLEAAA